MDSIMVPFKMGSPNEETPVSCHINFEFWLQNWVRNMHPCMHGGDSDTLENGRKRKPVFPTSKSHSNWCKNLLSCRHWFLQIKNRIIIPLFSIKQWKRVWKIPSFLFIINRNHFVLEWMYLLIMVLPRPLLPWKRRPIKSQTWKRNTNGCNSKVIIIVTEEILDGFLLKFEQCFFHGLEFQRSFKYAMPMGP